MFRRSFPFKYTGTSFVGSHDVVFTPGVILPKRIFLLFHKPLLMLLVVMMKLPLFLATLSDLQQEEEINTKIISNNNPPPILLKTKKDGSRMKRVLKLLPDFLLQLQTTILLPRVVKLLVVLF